MTKRNTETHAEYWARRNTVICKHGDPDCVICPQGQELVRVLWRLYPAWFEGSHKTITVRLMAEGFSVSQGSVQRVVGDSNSACIDVPYLSVQAKRKRRLREKAKAAVAEDVQAGHLPPQYEDWAHTVRIVSWQLTRLLNAQKSAELFFTDEKHVKIMSKLANRLAEFLLHTEVSISQE